MSQTKYNLEGVRSVRKAPAPTIQTCPKCGHRVVRKRYEAVRPLKCCKR